LLELQARVRIKLAAWRPSIQRQRVGNLPDAACMICCATPAAIPTDQLPGRLERPECWV